MSYGEREEPVEIGKTIILVNLFNFLLFHKDTDSTSYNFVSRMCDIRVNGNVCFFFEYGQANQIFSIWMLV